MPRKQDEVEKSLLRKGFSVAQGDHHYFQYYSLAGKKTRVFTKTSHGMREIGDGVLSMMAKQCKLTNKEFGRLIECPLDRSTYELGLIEKGFVEPPTNVR
ncbi:MAG: type II toxin-antitoxin system HicA family toxin [Gammaproteobacteria bacterium]|nr:type II toxin-antitoxin system HicA family toxin [Gammaproteobacteria bacterium]MBU1441561.1 type II toxin-antitoxin system HicA family toxin [Gammaproteobacteria bacterium]MBU2288953.1 type II toxin-antitoxin system HicA family toxin [Gammaproteobacteria bacterium]MBU2407325.1 type II toxin-antitoxin system HicA family toxin [Gammaproteobacteria bacterium]